MLLRFIKNWTLPLAMLAGTAGYFFFARVPLLAPVKPLFERADSPAHSNVDFCTIITYLCKVEVHDLKPKAWHGWLLLFQTVSCLAVAVLLVCCPMEGCIGKFLRGLWYALSALRPLPLRLLPVSWVGVHQALLPIHCCLIFWQRWLFRWCFLGLNRMPI